MADPKKTRAQADALIKAGAVEEGLKIYRGLCFQTKNVELRAKYFVALFKVHSEEGIECLTKLRDIYNFSSEAEKEKIAKILAIIGASSETPLIERIINGTFLYNKVHLQESMSCFKSVADDQTAQTNLRVDACKYMVSTELQENQDDAKAVLTMLLDPKTGASSLDRYKIIADFISRVGLVTYINREKLKVPYQEHFVHGLQTIFFFETANGVRERILSGQHLLQMDIIDEEERNLVTKSLFVIANDESQTENVRADAADVLLRCGSKEVAVKAREVISKLGKSMVGTKRDTIYDDSQNMHDENIAESVSKYITKLVNDPDFKPSAFNLIKEEISKTLRAMDKVQDKTRHFKIYKAMDRIELDTAVYTLQKVTLAEILAATWWKIRNGLETNKDLLYGRLFEELSEMSETCSSGHAGRFVNVFSGTDETIKISFETQLIANVSGRINARIREIKDPETRDIVLSGASGDATEEEIEIYKEWVKKALADIKRELYKEFVEEKYIGDAEFGEYFKKAEEGWL